MPALRVIFFLIVATSAGAQTVSIELEVGVFRVTGWKAPVSAPAKGWGSIFAVYTGPPDAPPLLGTYAVEGGALVFRPRFPFAPGVRYRAVFRSPAGGSPVEKIFEGPPRATVPEARVESVYPSAAVLPSNVLRLYLYFSAPMSRGEAAAHLHVLDSKGKVLEGIFLPGEELWDPPGRRLTMTFDPGRIKRGLTSNQTMGPPIAEGKLYTLAIDREWLDARGVAMIEGFRKTFRGGPAERVPPDPKGWRITPPRAGASGLLTVSFPKPMNYALLHRMLQVKGPHGAVAGTVSTGPGEMEWRFVPRGPWEAGNYQIVVDTAIEDLAGNRVGQPFDIDVFEHVTEHIDTRTVSLPFSVR
ncbi:MAG: Ig-like domain-containing protein [Bryobacteraceae bacterium]